MISAARLSERGTVKQPDRPFRRGSLSVVRKYFTTRAFPCQCIYADRGKVTGETGPAARALRRREGLQGDHGNIALPGKP